MAQRSKKLPTVVLRSSSMFFLVKPSGVATLVEGRRRDGTGWHGHGVVVDGDSRHLLLQVGAPPQEVDVVRGTYLGAAANTGCHHRVVLVALTGQYLPVPGVGFGGSEPTLGIDLRQLVQMRQVDVFYPDAFSRQRPQRALEGLGDHRIELVHHEVLGDGEPQARERHRFGHRDRFGGKHRIDDGAAFDGVGERTDRIERGRERHHAVDRHAPRRRLETDDAAHGGWNAHRAAGVGAKRRHGHTVGNRHRSTRRGAARHALAVGRVAWCAVMRVEADARERELAHVGAADDHRARRAQARHHGRVLGGDSLFFAHLGACECRLTFHVAKIFDRDRDSGERGSDKALSTQKVDRFGGGQRLAGPDSDESALALALGILDAGERFFGELA